MARFFLEERGKNPDYFYEEKLKRGWQHWGQYNMDKLDNQYCQAHDVIYRQDKAVGHAVRGVYITRLWRIWQERMRGFTMRV